MRKKIQRNTMVQHLSPRMNVVALFRGCFSCRGKSLGFINFLDLGFRLFSAKKYIGVPWSALPILNFFLRAVLRWNSWNRSSLIDVKIEILCWIRDQPITKKYSRKNNHKVMNTIDKKAKKEAKRWKSGTKRKTWDKKTWWIVIQTNKIWRQNWWIGI